ncbi:MAG: hypothetical protein U0271_09750 [Polyangiaceae bacterium]
MLSSLVGLVALSGLLAACEEPNSPFVETEFLLPDDAEQNDNGSIGPFCCTGRTVTVETKSGHEAGYAHFFFWDGQAFSDDKTSYAPNVIIDIAALADVEDETSELLQSRIFFDGNELAVGESRSQQVGAIIFTATVEEVDTYTFDGESYFDMATLKMSLTVETEDE